jgi:MerR family transcriptional regulator/heat shock protein HspR
MNEQTRALYVISVAAELAGVHPQTLRIYERKGLIEPARTQGRSRRYSPRDIEMLRRIQQLTNEGLNLAGVKAVLALEAKLDAVRKERDDARAEVARLRDEHVLNVEKVHRSYRRDLVPLSKSMVRVQRTGR